MTYWKQCPNRWIQTEFWTPAGSYICSSLSLVSTRQLASCTSEVSTWYCTPPANQCRGEGRLVSYSLLLLSAPSGHRGIILYALPAWVLALGTHRTILAAFFTATAATLVLCLPSDVPALLYLHTACGRIQGRSKWLQKHLNADEDIHPAVLWPHC